MAGRRQRDFRSGDLSEELGVLLLKGVAAVASVPRPEDVGLDAVATLLRDGPNDMLIAEDSFYVQFKAAGVKTVKFKEHEVRWLESLKLPFFIGSVRRADASITLYAAHRLSHVLVEAKNDREIEVVLDPDDSTTEQAKVGYRRISIGPSRVTWTIEDMSNRQVMEQKYRCLKPYLEVEQQNIVLRSLRAYFVIKWTTNEPTVPTEALMGHYQHGAVEDFLPIVQSLKAYVLAFRVRAGLDGNRSLMELAARLVEVARSFGVDHDPRNHSAESLAN